MLTDSEQIITGDPNGLDLKKEIVSRNLVKNVNFDAINLTKQEVDERLEAYELVRVTSSEQMKLFKSKYSRTPVQDILQVDHIRSYRIPLCFRDVDDDLEVKPSDENKIDEGI